MTQQKSPLDILSSAEVATEVAVSVDVVNAALRTGRLAGTPPSGNRSGKVVREDIVAWVRSGMFGDPASTRTTTAVSESVVDG